MNKKKIRNQIRTARREIPAPYRAAASAKIGAAFLKLPDFESAQTVAGFLAFDGEADPLGVMIEACNSGKQVFVPMIIKKGQPLMFSPWSPTSPMKTNSFGIEEPDVPQEQWITSDQLDFVITPLVAFDNRNYRIGVGGGFYDRTFAFRNEATDKKSGTKMFGFAFEIQRIKTIQPEAWDIRLDGVISETSS